MIKDFAFPLADLDGNDIRVADAPLTAAAACVNALLGVDPGDNPPGEEKARRYRLALLVHAGGEVELKPEDVALMKKLIGHHYGPLVVGPMYDFLDR